VSRKQPEFSSIVAGRRLEGDLLRNEAPSEASPGEGMLVLKDLMLRLLGRWHWIALGLILGLGTGFLLIWNAVPKYRSAATVVVRDYNLNALGTLQAAEFDTRNSQAIATVAVGLTTYELCEAVASDPVVRELRGIIPPPSKLDALLSGDDEAPEKTDVPPPHVLADMIRGQWLSVAVREETRLIDVAIRHPEPLVAQTIANRMVSNYMKLRSESRSGEQRDTLEYLMAESKRVKEELQEAMNVLASYSGPIEAEKALATAETEIDALSLRYRHKHPKMIEAKARLAHAREDLKKFMVKAVNNPLDGEYWSAHLERLGDLDKTETIDQLRDLLIARRAVLESEIETQNALYESVITQIETRDINTKQNEAEVALIESARLPGKPVFPRKVLMVIQATALGLFMGVGLAFLFQWLDNKFHTVSDIEGQLGLPVLSAVASLDPKEIAREEKRKGDSALVEGRERWDPLIVFRTEGADTHYAEMFRVLRTALSLLGPAQQRQVTMVTSSLPSEGKTLVSANLAVALAQQGVNTLLVDFDLRKPSVHTRFGVAKDAQVGTVNLLTGDAELDEVIQTDTAQGNLSLILSGPRAPNPGELLEPLRLEAILNQFKARFDHIVVDTAPLLAVPDSRIIAPYADNLAIVVRAESTPRGAVRRALETLEHSGVTPEGIVFNDYAEKRTLIGKNYSYGYYRYGKYGYGKYQYGAVYGKEDG